MKSSKVNNYYTTRKVLIRNGKDFFLSYTGRELVWDWVNLNDVWLLYVWGFWYYKAKHYRTGESRGSFRSGLKKN